MQTQQIENNNNFLFNHFKNPFNLNKLNDYNNNNNFNYNHLNFNNIKSIYFYIQKCIDFNVKQIEQLKEEKKNNNYYFINEKEQLKKIKCINNNYIDYLNYLWDIEIDNFTSQNDYYKFIYNIFISTLIKKYFAINKIIRWFKNIKSFYNDEIQISNYINNFKDYENLVSQYGPYRTENYVNITLINDKYECLKNRNKKINFLNENFNQIKKRIIKMNMKNNNYYYHYKTDDNQDKTINLKNTKFLKCLWINEKNYLFQCLLILKDLKKEIQ